MLCGVGGFAERRMNQEIELLIGLTLATVLGLVGQGIRAVAGYKKQQDEAAAKGETVAPDFGGARFWMPMLIGAIAGMVYYLTMKYGTDSGKIDFGTVTGPLGVVAAGYAGTDFIEAFVKKYFP
jgi:hypothetical protein